MNAPTAWTERCKTLAAPIVEACVVAPVAAGPAALAQEIARRLPELSFREVLCRGGWYRLGGVVGTAGERITDQLEAWASAKLDEFNGDLGVLQENFAHSGYRATHFAGRTHYLVAPAGQGTTDFLQLEIEDLQEVLAHPLFECGAEGETPPATLDEVLDARSAGRGENPGGSPIGLPTYSFRRLTHVGDILNRMWAQAIEAQPIHRFVADWEASSAARSTAFCNHWIIALREHLDRYRQPITRAQPVPAINGEPPRFTARQGTSGLALHEALTAFDRQVGYPMAWYFHMLTTRAAPHWVAAAVAEDAMAGFRYLPDRDLDLVKAWLHRSYGF